MTDRNRSLLPGIIERSYAARLGMALAFAIVVMVVFGLVISMQASATLEEDVEQELTSATQSEAAALDSWLLQVDRSVSATATTEVMVNGEIGAIQDRLTSLAERDQLPENVVGAHYIDTETGTIAASSDESIGTNEEIEIAGFAEMMTETDEHETLITEPVNIGDSDQQVIAAISPVDADGEHAVMYTADLQAQVNQSTLSREETETAITNTDGEYLAHPNQSLVGSSSSIGELRESYDGTATLLDDSDETLVTVAGLEQMDWRVVSTTDSATAFALSDQINSNLIGLLFLAVINLGLVGVTVGANTITSLRRLSGRAEEMAAGDLEVDLESSRTDEIGALYSSFDRMRTSLREQITTAEKAREEAEAASQEAQQARQEAIKEQEATAEVNEELQRKAEEYRSVLSAAARGDFTGRVSPDSSNQSMQAIGEEINTTLDALEETIAMTKSFTADVKQASEAAESNARAVRSASESVRKSTAEIRADATTQREQLEQAAAQMQSLSATAEEVASSAEEVAETSTQASEAGETGRKAAEKAIAEMKAIESETDDTVEEITTLAEDLQAIGNIVDLITEIVDQTNMLALNASIEAARADASGDGFAVVADEIKNLAEETRDAAADIESRIERIQNQASETVKTMESTSDRVSSGTETVEDAIDSLEQILKLAEEVDGGMQEIDTATGEQARTAQDVMMVIDELNDLSQETESETERVADAAAEQTESIDSVADAAGDLNDSAVALVELLEQFTVNGDSHAIEKTIQVTGGEQ